MERRASFHSLFVFELIAFFVVEAPEFPHRFVYVFVVIHNLQPAHFYLFLFVSL